MNLPAKPRCYNAGKISGLSWLDAYSKFERADKRIEKKYGLNPVNPMKHGLHPSRPWWMHMVYDLWLMMRCEVVYFQQDWKESRGARIEYKVAKFFGKKIQMKTLLGE